MSYEPHLKDLDVVEKIIVLRVFPDLQDCGTAIARVFTARCNIV